MRKRVLVCALLCAAVGIGGTAATALAGASSTSKGGAIKVWVTPSKTGTTTSKHPGKVMFTGAIGDYGTSFNVTSTGKPAKKKSPYKLLKLKKGTMTVTASALGKALKSAKPTLNTTNCSVTVAATAPITIVKGTGAYANISGTVTFSASYAVILPKTSSGKCTTKTSTKALATYASFIGTGTVSFS
jgi:hypothetical protein